MNETKLKQRLVQELPPVPESFHLAVTGTLNRLVAEEQTKPQEKKRNPIPMRRVLLLAALLVLGVKLVYTCKLRLGELNGFCHGITSFSYVIGGSFRRWGTCAGRKGKQG